MGELEKEKGAWGYVEGGMGGVSQSIARSARSLGADMFTNRDVEQVLIGQDGSAKGVVLTDGTEVHSKVVLSNATPYITFKQLTPQDALPEAFITAVDQIDYTSPVTKINGKITENLTLHFIKLNMHFKKKRKQCLQGGKRRVFIFQALVLGKEALLLS
ncbi:pyridine nucleotide-disulfide oxidoreductase domain-containing protein 2-like [Sinocyclocheilus grahami]|uniref:pyridine nucleotide-disulfide oxidoreductase domain-containing protein 2-like n=1 Tax=Sinocyclocheilus grahami TaxID=75366 RepID=UPI0007AC5E71|nr:PREDICTED: pyridine nucleotide-disulfide oxidoreductase domain-containing protein 2-like [Sinocyclocheilus grahami]